MASRPPRPTCEVIVDGAPCGRRTITLVPVMGKHLACCFGHANYLGAVNHRNPKRETRV